MGRGKCIAQLETWGIERDHGGAGLPRRDPKQPRRTLVLVGVRNGTLLLRCENPCPGPQRRHTQTALLCAGARDPVATTWEQVGYSVADFSAKAVFGVLIWAIAAEKSKLEEEGSLIPK